MPTKAAAQTTLGNWRVWQLANDPATYGEDAGKLIITTEDGEIEITGVVEVEANAHLLAAAPTMLKALRVCIARMDERAEGRGKWTAADQRAYDAATAAIARAEGTDNGLPFTVVGSIDLGNERFAHHVVAADAAAAEQQINDRFEEEAAGVEWAIAAVLFGHLYTVDEQDSAMLSAIDRQQDDDGCPKNDPDCTSLNGECHDACEAPTCPNADGCGNSHGYHCPTCRECEGISICAKVMHRLETDGTQEYGDVEWTDDSFATCKCGWVGTVADLIVVEVDE